MDRAGFLQENYTCVCVCVRERQREREREEREKKRERDMLRFLKIFGKLQKCLRLNKRIHWKSMSFLFFIFLFLFYFISFYSTYYFSFRGFFVLLCFLFLFLFLPFLWGWECHFWTNSVERPWWKLVIMLVLVII